MMKNLPIRLKFVSIYINMSVFTIPILIISLIAMRWINQAESGAGTQIVNAFTVIYPIYIVVYVLVTILLGRKLTKLIAFPIKDLAENTRKLATGDINIPLDYESGDEVGALVVELRQLVAAIRHQSDVLTVVADGDYTASIPVRSEEDIMNRAINQLIERNNVMLNEIRSSASQVSSAAAQISNGAQSLATGSSEQAASIEEFNAALTELQEKTNHNADNSAKAQEANTKTAVGLADSIRSMGEMLEAMKAIDESSQNITKVIKVIDDIAFQTNILALNAAVEAARAGQHGKGFAVVADEVRNLAAKSAEAARETAELIEGSSERVKEGNEIVKKTNSNLESAAENARESTRIVEQVASASINQARAITEINQGMEQISTIVQANSATAEESAAASEEMSTQAIVMNEIIARFKLRQEVHDRIK